MTIDDRPRNPGGRGEGRSMGSPRSTRRDLERYAGLFAARTKVMTSSAMRDLMAITERDEVISLAGGLPDTSTFPPKSYASIMERVAMESSARALQYGPTEGLEVLKTCIVEVMAEEGIEGIDRDEVLVTTGGQQVIDLMCKTLIDPGDVIVAEAPTYPGAVPAFSAYEADVVQIEMDRDGMRTDVLEETLDQLERDGRRPKFIYTVPTFQNPAGVTLSLPRRERIVRLANERELLVLEDNPYGLLRYEGDALPTLRAAATRCSMRWPSSSRARPNGPTPRAVCSSGRRCPTTSTRPTCWRARCRRTLPSSPAARRSSTGAAAPRCGSTSRA